MTATQHAAPAAGEARDAAGTGQHPVGQGADRALPDEVPPGEMQGNLALALGAADAWRERRERARTPEFRAEFLDHAVRTVPLYRDAVASTSGPLSLDRFPVVARTDLRSNGDPLRSDEWNGLRPELRAYTNGTVAPQLRVSFDPPSWYDFNYGTYDAVAQRVPHLPDTVVPGRPGVYLVTDMPYAERASVLLPTLRLALFRRLPIARGPAEDAAVAEYLRAADPPLLYGKPSTLIELMERDTALGGGGIRARTILVSGESLYEEDRAKIEAWSGGRIYNAYISTEGGLIALECEHRTGLHVREDRVRLEVLRADGSIAPEGTGDVLLTNFFNWAHVFVRYRLGDRVTLQPTECACGFRGMNVARLWGRDLESYETPGGRIDTPSLAEAFAPADVKQYQVVQTPGGRLSIRWIPLATDVREIAGATERIRGALAARLDGVAFDLVPVRRIMRPGGKLRRFLRETA